MPTNEAPERNREQLEAEVARLRRLVGPNEMSYADALLEREQASNAVREAQAELGLARSEITALQYTLHRAVQDQHHIRRAVLSPALRARHWFRTRRC